MAADDKKNKAGSESKKEPPKAKSAVDASSTKAENVETAAAAPSSYSRGEGQKPTSQAYKDNWDAIFAKKRR